MGKKIIPISIEQGLNPYGFVRKFQSLKLKIEQDIYYEWIDIAGKISALIMKDTIFAKAVRDSIVETFAKSGSYQFTRRMIPLIRELSLDDDQINKITQAISGNQNIYDEVYQFPSFKKWFKETFKSKMKKESADEMRIEDLPF